MTDQPIPPSAGQEQAPPAPAADEIDNPPAQSGSFAPDQDQHSSYEGDGAPPAFPDQPQDARGEAPLDQVE